MVLSIKGTRAKFTKLLHRMNVKLVRKNTLNVANNRKASLKIQYNFHADITKDNYMEYRITNRPHEFTKCQNVSWKIKEVQDFPINSVHCKYHLKINELHGFRNIKKMQNVVCGLRDLRTCILPISSLERGSLCLTLSIIL